MSDAELDRGLDIINSEMTCAEFHDSVWGFVVRIYPLDLSAHD